MRMLRTLVIVGMCCVVSLAARGQVKVSQLKFNDFDAYRLSNGLVETIVVPELGRVVVYGFIGQRNQLWDNTKGVRTRPYMHFGGEKVWAWPQGEWEGEGKKSGWPPPGNMDPMKFEVKAEKGALHLKSVETLKGYGVRVHRVISLAPQGTELTMENRFEQVEEGRDQALALWSVAQVPVPEMLMVRVANEAGPPEGFSMMSPRSFKSVRRVGGEVLHIERTPEASTKLGFDATVMGAYNDGILFVARLTKTTPEGATYEPGEQGQIYSNQDPPAGRQDALPAYIELEYTSPKVKLKRGESSSLTLVWKLEKVEGEKTPEGLAQALAERLKKF